MSEYDHHEDERRERHPEAKVHTAKWSPWIWIVPAIAIFIAAWLVVRYGFFGGGSITVHFVEARGLDRYSPVRFRGAKVGTVQKITVSKDLREVIVNIAMDASMNHALNSGTRFWIVEPGLETGGLSGLLSGTYIAMAPGSGQPASEFVGQEYEPILAPPAAGKTVILEGTQIGSIASGVPVEFHGMRVGRVLGSEWDQSRGANSVAVWIEQRFADEVRTTTRFWRAGGLNVSLSGAGLSMGGQGIASLLTAPVSFTTPDVLAGAPAPQGTRFQLYETEPQAEAAADGPQLTYVTYFPGSVHGLQPGTPVQMKGVDVGRVRDVKLLYVPQTATLVTPVTLEIDPRKLGFGVSDMTPPQDVRAEMNDALAKLVQKGMRATLSTSLVLPGASGVSLDMVGAPGSARLGTGQEPPVIPASPAGSGIEGALGSLNEIAGRIRNLPIEEIAGHLKSTAARLDTLVHDPVIDESLQRLNRSLADVEKITATTRENVGPIVSDLRSATGSAADAAKKIDQNVAPIVQSLRNAAASAESAATRAEQLLGTSPKQNYDLSQLIKELTRAAEAVRGLASYLEENPDALLKGRGKAK